MCLCRVGLNLSDVSMEQQLHPPGVKLINDHSRGRYEQFCPVTIAQPCWSAEDPLAMQIPHGEEETTSTEGGKKL